MNNLTTLAVILGFSTPIITIVANLISEHLKRKHEAKMFFAQNYYKDCTETFSFLLNSLGQLLVDGKSDAKVFEVLPLIYRACTYADKALFTSLNHLYVLLETWNNDFNNEQLRDKCQLGVFDVVKDINYFLSKNFNNMK